MSNLFYNFFSISPNLMLAHEMLVKFHRLEYLIKFYENLKNGFFEFLKKNFKNFLGLKFRENKKLQLNILWKLFEFEELNDLWLNIFIELFECTKSASMACFQLFGRAAEYSRRDQLQKLIPVIKRLLDNSNVLNANVIFNLFFF